jgi:hypothetical protein
VCPMIWMTSAGVSSHSFASFSSLLIVWFLFWLVLCV